MHSPTLRPRSSFMIYKYFNLGIFPHICCGLLQFIYIIYMYVCVCINLKTCNLHLM